MTNIDEKRRDGLGSYIPVGSVDFLLAFLGLGAYFWGASALDNYVNGGKNGKNSRLLKPAYQSLPAEGRDYDNNPRDGCLNAEELQEFSRDFEFKKM